MKEVTGKYTSAIVYTDHVEDYMHPEVLIVLKEAKSVREASDAVLLWYEKPADQSEAVQVKRAGTVRDIIRSMPRATVFRHPVE